ncbi:hypothetical protein [Limosilactobacillus equigenerosi]|uniref:Uncharacterized protein n=1 Tax=Limosilactobacillus equigenerosi DSM 18793 = JCM 14505 TaxID=1423742 RepID=A0A0R1UTF7_9LACO|nr:hypothetical protein [Limosilactobacillus equigenerosi]KRL93259.1 hypothetical protein FC21_GL000013 [Limosilactobacillus equigenerosi DSM 18793 = JCM 14505]
MISLNNTDFQGKKMARQQLVDMVQETIDNQPNWDQVTGNICASFHVDYEILDGNMEEHEGRVEVEYTANEILDELYTAFVDDEVIDEVWNDSDSSFSNEDLSELLDRKGWDFGDVYPVIEKSVVNTLAHDLENEAGLWIMLDNDQIVNVTLD